ncbi:MAG: ribonuclease H-like domain-containing protein [Candidatus Limnocylindrales bacterium]
MTLPTEAGRIPARPPEGPAVTGELARLAASLPAMDRDPTLLARRLERLRALDGRLRTAAELPPPPPRPVPLDSTARATRLADRLGGRVAWDGALGPVVIVERSVALPVDLDGLARLPYGIAVDHPLVCLDTETTGLGTGSGTVAFLVGIGRWDGASFRVRPLLLPDHADEAALLAAIEAEIGADAWLVTYNGRSFDWPLLEARYRLHRRSPPTLAGHLDLLPIARQLWKHRLPDARLASVEAGVAGVRRHEDLPGALIPDRFFGWLRSGRPELLADVLEHNREDVVSLARLLVRMSEDLADPRGRRAAHPGDVAALARAFGREGRPDDALGCYAEALAAWDEGDPAPSRLDRDAVAADAARLLSRTGRHAEAAAAWQSLAERGGAWAVWAWIALAKHHEHRAHDRDGALVAALRALRIVERRRAVGVPLWSAERDLGRRLARLRRRAAAPPPRVRAARAAKA